MSRRLFRKALNHIESRSCDSNISRLNDELKKTGMLSERMTTSTVLPPTETQPFIPPTTSDIPDTSGLLGDNFSQPSYGGNESDPSTWDTGWNSNAYLKNPNTLDGVANRPILALPDAPYPYDDGAGDSAIVTYGGFYGTSVGLITPDNRYRQILVGGLIGGTEVPSEESRGLFGIYRGLTDEQFNYAVAIWNTYSQLYAKRLSGEIGFGSFKVWITHSPHHHGSYNTYGGVKSGGRILTTVTYFKQASTYTSDPGQPKTVVLNRLDDPSSPDYYEGDFSRFLANLLDVGKQAFDYLSNKSEQILSNQTVKDITNVLTGVDDSAVLDFLQGVNDKVISPIFNKLGQATSQLAGVKTGLVASAAFDINGTVTKAKNGGDSEVFLRGGDFPAMLDTGNESQYTANLATSLMKSIATGDMVMINDSNLSPSIVGPKLTSNDIKTALSNHEVQDGAPKPLSTDADSILNPTNKETYFGGKGFGGEGGSILEPYISEDGTPMLKNTADKFLRVGGESGEKYDITTQQFTDIPSPSQEDLKKTLESAKDRGLYELMKQVTENEDLTYDQYEDGIDNSDYLKTAIPIVTGAGKFVFDTPLGAKGTGFTTGLVNGAAIGAVLYGELKKTFGGANRTELDDKGGKGHVRRETNISINDLNPEQQKVFMNELDKRGIEYNKNWNRVEESFTISEGWQSPDHTNVEKDSKTRWFNPNAGTDSAKWFDPKEVKPAYPAKAPPKMIDGYSATSNLAPKSVEKSPAIKLTKKDLLRNHRLKDSEVAEMMQTVDRINKFIADHPEELIFAKSRYPKHDPRLAELNWNMDQMLKASGEYLDKQFPENERLFTRIQNSIIKNIKATDPEEYKEVISTIETEKKARIIKKSHLSRKVSERERKSAFSRALKHLPTEARVQSDVTKERIEEIAKAELEYLKTIGKPKYYDWKDDGFDFSENFEDRKKSIQHFHSLIDKRIENLENALEEGMTTSEYIKQLYGEIPTITSIMSIDPNLLGSKFAQDVVQDSEKATTHAYGSYFPGSYVNSIGDFNPQSYSKVDVLATASWNSLQSLAPSGWEPDNSYEYFDSVSDVVSFGPETDTFKDTYFGEVTTSGNTISLSTGDDEDSSQENTIDILDLESLFPGVTFPTANPMPGETTREDPIEGSMLLRTFKSIKVGQEISFNYSFTSAETEENPEYVTYRGVSDTGVPGEDAILDDYAFVLIAGRVQKIVSVMAKDGNNIDFNFQGTDADGNPVTTEYKPDILQSRFPLTGKYSYTVRQDDIDDHGNLKLFIGVMDAGDSAYESNLDITNLEIDISRSAAGQLGKTTDAYNLGTSVASLDPNSKKKKKDEEDDETDSTEQDQEDKDTITKNGITYDKGAYNVLGPYTPSVDKVELYPTYSDIKGQTEPPEPGTEYYTSYYRFYVPKEGPEYEAWLSSIPAEQAAKIKAQQAKADPAANQKYVGKFQMFGKPKLYGKYGDKSYYNPADTGQEVPNQVKITWNDLGAPTRQDRFGQILANPGEKQDSYGFPLGKDEEESDYTYWKGKRYLKGSYDDTAEIDPKTGKFRGNFSWFAEKDPASAKTGNSDTMSTTTNWKGPRAAWEHREFIGLGPNEEIEQVIQYRKHRDLMRKKYGRLSDIPKQYHKNNNYLESLNRLVVATMPKDWARPFVPVDGEGPEDKLTNNYADQVARGEEPVPPIPKGNAEADLIAELMLLGPVSVALAKALIAALGLAGASALTKGARVLDQFAKWWNKGKNVRIKDEDSADLFQLFADDIAQRQGIRGPGGQGGWNPFRGMPGYGTAKSKLNPRIRAINKARRAQGKPELSMDKINPGGAQSGPSPSVRQGGRVLTKPLGPTLGARNESYDLIFEQVDPDDKFFQELQKVIVKLKKPEQVEKLSKFLKKVSKAKEESESKTTRPNNSNELYPGQPSPNGFPDTPPPNLAPNGYHPEFGKRANRYRRLDPVSAVMMRKVGTDDPQTNKQVSDAAKKPK